MTNPNDQIQFIANGRWARLIPQIMVAVGGVALLTTFGVVVTSWYHQRYEYPVIASKIDKLWDQAVGDQVRRDVERQRYEEAIENQRRLTDKIDTLMKAIHETNIRNAREGH